MAGEAGFEPTHTGVKVLCLTAWRLPNEQYFNILINKLQEKKREPEGSLKNLIIHPSYQEVQQSRLQKLLKSL